MRNIEAIKEIQDKVLSISWKLAKEIPEWKLSGGTALVRFYGFNHRFSEDLDFFFEHSPEKISKIIPQWEALMVKESPEMIFSRVNMEGKGMLFVQRFFIEHMSYKETIVIDFVTEPFPFLYAKEILKNDSGVTFRVDPVNGIAIKKLWALHNNILQRILPRPKDIVDFYVLCEERIDFISLLAFYQSIFPNVPCESLLLTVKDLVHQLDYSNILELKIDLQKMFEWYREKLLENLAKFRKFLEEQEEVSEEDLKAEIFRLKYPGP